MTKHGIGSKKCSSRWISVNSSLSGVLAWTLTEPKSGAVNVVVRFGVARRLALPGAEANGTTNRRFSVPRRCGQHCAGGFAFQDPWCNLSNSLEEVAVEYFFVAIHRAGYLP